MDNKEKIKLVSRPNKIKEFIDVVEDKNVVGQIKPFHAGETFQNYLKHPPLQIPLNSFRLLLVN